MSVEPPYKRRWRERAEQQKDSRNLDKNTEGHKATSGALESLADQVEGYRKEQGASDKRRLSLERWTVGLAAAAFLGTIASYCVLNTQLHLQFRAYMTPIDTQILKKETVYGQTGPFWILIPRWQNVGDTPADDFRVWEEMIPVNKVDDPPIAPPPLFNEPNTGSVVGAKQIINGTGHTFTNAEINTIDDRKSTVAFLYGLAAYRDVFGEKHVAMTCEVINSPLAGFKDGDDIGPHSPPDLPCTEYNCTDEGCRPYAKYVPPGIVP